MNKNNEEKSQEIELNTLLLEVNDNSSQKEYIKIFFFVY